MEHLLPGSEKSKNFRSMEHSLLTFAPWNFRTPGTFAPQRTFVPFNFRSCGTFAPVLKKLWKAEKQCFHRRILANVRCCLLEQKRCHVYAYIITSVRTIQGKADRSDPVLISLCSYVVQYRSSTEMRTQKARSGPCVNSLLIIITHAAC